MAFAEVGRPSCRLTRVILVPTYALMIIPHRCSSSRGLAPRADDGLRVSVRSEVVGHEWRSQENTNVCIITFLFSGLSPGVRAQCNRSAYPGPIKRHIRLRTKQLVPPLPRVLSLANISSFRSEECLNLLAGTALVASLSEIGCVR